MPESLDKIAEQIVAAMIPAQRQGFLRSVVGGAGSSFPEPSGGFADIFAARQPEFGPVPDRVRGLRVRLDLSGTKPPVWRRLLLPGDLTLDRLDDVIQAAMGGARHAADATDRDRRQARVPAGGLRRSLGLQRVGRMGAGRV